MSLSYKPGNRIISIPPSVAKELEQFYVCDNCKCRYSFLGTAYFCPACGNENIEGNIKEWLKNIENFIEKYSEINIALLSTLSEEDVKSYLLQLIEDHYCKIVSIFQKFSETKFKKYPGSDNIKTRKNLFQNLDESSMKWKELTGVAFEDIVDRSKYLKIKDHFQIRHLLSHTSGIIDDDFIKKTNSTSYVVGKRVIVTVGLLKDFLLLIKEFMNNMENEY